jgi:ABC-type sugar transport system ATPase subunit
VCFGQLSNGLRLTARCNNFGDRIGSGSVAQPVCDMRVDIENLDKAYSGRERHRALCGVSLSAEDGEFLVLLGPSGSGKTTLLRAIAGLEITDSGNIRFGGRVVNDLDPGRRNVGMVFQDYALYPHLTVYENVAYNMRIRKLPRGEIESRVKKVATMLRIDQLLQRRPSELSGGQRQRVAVARAITRDASVLLMDEPLSNLDTQIREHVRVELRELQRLIGVTTIYVTHDQVEAMVMADRIAVMSDGRVEQVGVPSEVYGRPETLFCARFVGSPRINELEGTLCCSSAGSLVFAFGPEHGGKEVLELVADGLSAVPRSDGPRAATLAFRAEDVMIMQPGDDSLSADVAFVENRGSEKYLLVILSEEIRSAQVSSELRLRLPSEHQPSHLSKVSFLPRRVHLFDGDGRRLLTASCQRASAGIRKNSLACLQKAREDAAVRN